MSISIQNLLRQIGSGYGGGGSSDPYAIYAAMLGESSGDLAAKKYNEQFGLQKEQFGEQKRQFDVTKGEQTRQFDVNSKRLQSQLDEMIKEANTRTTLQLANSGFGTKSELNKYGQGYGLSYNPTGGQIGTGLVSGASGGSSGGGGNSLQSLLAAYQQVSPYSNRLHQGRINTYDPTMAKVKQNISKLLMSYR